MVTDVIGGYSADATTMYGPSHASLFVDRDGDVPGVAEDVNLYGANSADKLLGGLPSLRHLYQSPAGLVLIGLLVGFVLFKYVFGVS